MVKGNYYFSRVFLIIICLLLIQISPNELSSRISSAYKSSIIILSPLAALSPLGEIKSGKEVFGFAPYWTIDKMDNVDFSLLTTFAYFGVPVDTSGNLDKSDTGYDVFMSRKATNLFQEAHDNGARVVLTITQMDNYSITALMDNPEGQENTISQTVQEVKNRGIDGVNIDFEYMGDPGQEYRDKFSLFARNFTERMHGEIPGSKVTVSVYASAVKDPKIYDIKTLSENTDGIFMMAYDFATTSSDNAIPTAPLYGHKEGKYWYDISTAIEDFLAHMSADKLILGVPYYGYNYLVYTPEVKAETLPYYSWQGRPVAQTYSDIEEMIKPEEHEEKNYTTGWDDYGKVGWKAYFDELSYTWRMVFSEDVRSLGLKYDLAKEKDLKGVGIWALGFDDGKKELWDLIREKFGANLASGSMIQRKSIHSGI